jgi:hypothetical protein
MIEQEAITLEDGLSFATNQNNLLLQLKGLSSTEDYANAHKTPSNPAVSMPLTAQAPKTSVLDMIE